MKRQKILLLRETINLVVATATVAKSTESLVKNVVVVAISKKETIIMKVVSRKVLSAKVIVKVIVMVETEALSRIRTHGSGSFTTLNALSMSV